MISSRKQKIVTQVVFGIYLVLLVWLVLFKLSTDLSAITPHQAINLIPFFREGDASIGIIVREILFNVLVFVPLGAYVCVFSYRFNTWKFSQVILKSVKTAFLISLAFEVVQYIFAIGISDTTDLIANVLGALMGCLLMKLLYDLTHAKAVTIVNVLGILIEAAAIALIVMMTVANV